MVHNHWMKQRQTKAELRAELARQVQSFIEQGGTIHQAGMGESGLKDGKYNTSQFGFNGQIQERTPVSGLLGTIDARRHKKTVTAPVKTLKRSRKKIIYDDFGEPLRWVWVDE